MSACLERYGVLPEEISCEILRDVALGLCFLHERSPPIIHRDLSPNNVLLTSNMNAKLSDLGVAKILNLTPARMTQMTQTKAPGTPCYMPPEALTAKPKYTTKIDVYSYGVLIIHTLCGRWPFPEDAFRPDPRNPDAIIPASEIEHRAEYLQEIGNDHPLIALIQQCLSNMPSRRPETPALLDQVNTILSALPQQFTNRVEMLQQFEARIQTLTAANQSKQSEIDSLTQSKQSEIESLRAEVKRLSVQRTSQQAHSQPNHTSESDMQIQVYTMIHVQVAVVKQKQSLTPTTAYQCNFCCIHVYTQELGVGYKPTLFPPSSPTSSTPRPSCSGRDVLICQWEWPGHRLLCWGRRSTWEG